MKHCHLDIIKSFNFGGNLIICLALLSVGMLGFVGTCGFSPVGKPNCAGLGDGCIELLLCSPQPELGIVLCFTGVCTLRKDHSHLCVSNMILHVYNAVSLLGALSWCTPLQLSNCAH